MPSARPSISARIPSTFSSRRVNGHELEPLVDESVFLGLGTAIAARGYLGGQARAELAAALARYTQTARGLGARTVTFIGTEPIRRAADAARIVAEVVAGDAALRSTSSRMRRRRFST